MNAKNAALLKESLEKQNVTLVAVSKTKPNEMIQELYNEGFRIFGENRAQELVEKYESLPKDIKWHMIGNLQKNKVKYIAPFVTLIHSVSSLSLLQTINKEAFKHDRKIDILLQLKIAEEDTKSGLSKADVRDIIQDLNSGAYSSINIVGFMGMATFTDDMDQVRGEFQQLISSAQSIVNNSNLKIDNPIYSMGMSGDYKVAIEEGSNMVRIGSLLFGSR